MNCVQSLWFLLALMLSEFNSVQSIGGIGKICDWSDSNCLTKAARNIHTALVSGNKSPIDPLFTAKRNEDFEGLKYKLSDVTLTGLRNCRVILLKFVGLGAFEYELYCPKLIIDFTYDAKGLLDDLNFDGVGMGTETTDNYFITLKGRSDVYVSKRDNKPRLAFKDLHVETNLKGKYTFENKKQIRGVKEHFDLAAKWLNNMVTSKGGTGEYHTLKHFMTLYIKELNRYLRDIPLEQAFSST